MHERGGVKGQQNIFVFKFFLTCLRIHIFISWIYISSWLKNQTVLQEETGHEGKWDLTGLPSFCLIFNILRHSRMFVCDSFNACAYLLSWPPVSMGRIMVFEEYGPVYKLNKGREPEAGNLRRWTPYVPFQCEQWTKKGTLRLSKLKSGEILLLNYLLLPFLFLRLLRPPEFREDDPYCRFVPLSSPDTSFGRCRALLGLSRWC